MNLPLLLQVASVLTLSNSEATTHVRNPSTTEAFHVTVALHHATQVGSTVTLNGEVRALVSPAAFDLRPGEDQVLRLRLRETIAPGTVLRLVTVFTPTQADTPAPGSETTAVARLITVIRLITKVVVGR
jgi:hypothetical protein